MEAMASPQSASARSGLTIISRGRDKPGIAMAFMKSLEGHDCQVMGITQFTLSGILVFTFELEIGEGSSYRLMKDLRLCADSQGMDLDFRFPDEKEVDPQRDNRKAVLAIGSACSITPSALCEVDAVLSQNGCTVEEIEHRGDNKIEYNGEFNKVQMIVRCPPGCSLATLYLGLIQVEGAEVTVRWWDAMNRPHGKSLVVFGLSNVLCPYNVLDELLKEADVDANAMSGLADSDVSWESREQKNCAADGQKRQGCQLLDRKTGVYQRSKHGMFDLEGDGLSIGHPHKNWGEKYCRPCEDEAWDRLHDEPAAGSARWMFHREVWWGRP